MAVGSEAPPSQSSQLPFLFLKCLTSSYARGLNPRSTAISAGPLHLPLSQLRAHRTLCLELLTYLYSCLSRPGKPCLCLEQLSCESISGCLPHLQIHTNHLWACRSLGFILTEIQMFSGVRIILNFLFILFYSTEKAGSRGGVWPISLRPRLVSLRVSSKLSILGQAGHLTL